MLFKIILPTIGWCSPERLSAGYYHRFYFSRQVEGAVCDFPVRLSSPHSQIITQESMNTMQKRNWSFPCVMSNPVMLSSKNSCWWPNMFLGENCTSPVMLTCLHQSDTYRPSSVLSVLGNRLYLALWDTSPTLPQEVQILLCRREACPGTAIKGWSTDWLTALLKVITSSAMNISYRESCLIVDWQRWMTP